ncbi:hypothetical protein [Martelella alba]|uniref:Uncharacterized protein n=1 Tax=Martelella alba TaxID=2590451 RepID=A0ABY2SKG4_9HYPH|nr:hypothetical protein [Martelella alba]TKI05787.1 hypothetical protein FCN80_12675 [Martelella alba]
MATTPTSVHALLSHAIRSTTDFITLAEHCDRLSEALLECHDDALCQALLTRLSQGLALLRPALDAPLPPNLIESLTVDELPTTAPCFEPDSDLLCEYCQILAQLLEEKDYRPEREPLFKGLLFELMNYLSGELRAPRWIRTADGVKILEEVLSAEEDRMP